MKFLRNLMEKIEPTFSKGGKLEKYHPVYDGFYTFLFTPDHTTKKGAHIRDGVDLKRTMSTVILALIPCLLFGMWNTGYQHYLAMGEDPGFWATFGYGFIQVLPLVIVSYGVGLGVEFIFCIAKGHQIQEGFLVSGMLIPLCLPVDVPLWMVAVATIFAVVIGKEVFGGTGMNILNIALTTRAFLFFAYPTKMSGNEVWVSNTAGIQESGTAVDGFTGATALGDLATFTGDKADWAFSNVEAFAAKYTVSDAFLGFIPGSVGETSALACLIGALILIGTGVGSWKIMTSFFIGGLSMAFLFNIWGANQFMEVEPIHQLVLGGFMFGMVFMATDPVTAAQTGVGKIIYGFLGGFLGIMIRVFNPAYPEGIMMAILFMNIMAPLIDHYVIQANIKKRMNRLKVKTA